MFNFTLIGTGTMELTAYEVLKKYLYILLRFM